MSEIHPTAVIHPEASLGEGTCVGPYSVIGAGVKLGKGNIIHSHVVLDGNTTVGDENQFFQFCSIGAAPQDLKYHGENSTLEIGNKNIVREYATLQPGTEGGGMRTAIGDENLFMACSHIGHDSFVGNNCIFANSAAIAGHVHIGNFVTVGGLCGIHQNTRLGDSCFLGGGAMVGQDIPPFCMAQGDRAMLIGVNTLGLKRRDFSDEQISKIKKLFRSLFYGSGSFVEKLRAAKEAYSSDKVLNQLISFCESAERGVASVRNG